MPTDIERCRYLDHKIDRLERYIKRVNKMVKDSSLSPRFCDDLKKRLPKLKKQLRKYKKERMNVKSRNKRISRRRTVGGRRTRRRRR